jgi:zinc-ribbon domain
VNIAANYCKNCDASIPPGSNFCKNCGQPLDAAPTIKQESYNAPQTSAHSPSAAFWLGLIGGVLGLLIGVDYLYLYQLFGGSIANALLNIGSAMNSDYFLFGSWAIIFSFAGIIGGLRIVDEDRANAILMILAGGMILLLALDGVLLAMLPALLFFLGGGLTLLGKG